MQGFIDNGYEHFEPLLEFRDWLKDFSLQHENRMTERRNGQVGLGPFTPDARRKLLERLLETQSEIESSIDLKLISEAEIERIKEIWRDDEARALVRKADRLLALMEDNSGS